MRGPRSNRYSSSFAASLLVLALLAAAVGTSAAAAATGPEFQFQFPSPGADQSGSGPGQLFVPTGVATNGSGTHVYVADKDNHRISVYSAWGRFRFAFGWGVADGTSEELQVCTATCFAGLGGSGSGQLQLPSGIAVDGDGNVYVTEGPNWRVQKFSPAGEFLLMFGGGVNVTTGADVCTAVSGDVCGAGAAGEGPGEFESWGFNPMNIAAAGDTIYVGDKGRIQAFAPDGTLKGEIPVAAEQIVQYLALDPVSGDLYYADRQVFEADPHVYRITAAGAPVCTATLASPASRPMAIAAGPGGELYVVDDPASFGVEGIEPHLEQFGPDCEPVASYDEPPPSPLSTKFNGLATNRLGDLYVATSAEGGQRHFVSFYGPLPSEIEPAPAEAPTIEAQYAATVATTTAVLKAVVNPHFFGSTTLYLEYGTEDCAAPGAGCALVPAPPGTPLGGGEREEGITGPGIPLAGLLPDTTYHYRFVALSGGFTTRGLGSGEQGPGASFTTRRAVLPGLPDGRAYEQVSPPEKNQGEVVPVPPNGGAVENAMAKPQQASPSGDAFTYTSFASFADPRSAPGTTQYLSRRTASGWQTANITPPATGFPLRDPLRGFSEDLGVGAVVQHDPPLLPAATPGIEHLYLQDNASGALRLLTPEPPRLQIDNIGYCIGYFGASDDYRRVIFFAMGALTPDAPEGQRQSLYEWSEEGGLRLVSVLPDGTPAPAESINTGFGTGPVGGGANCPTTNSLADNAISADGSRIFWTFVAPYKGAGKTLFARVGGVETVQLDAPQGVAGSGGEGLYWAASTDGSKVFFTSPRKLLPEAKAAVEGKPGDLYRYDFDAAAGEELSDLTAGSAPAEVLGVLGAAEDGSRAYFVARAALAPGATSGQRNLYLWSEGEETRYIATLSGKGDPSNWGATASDPAPFSERQTARVTSDGAHLAFLSSAPIGDYDNISQATGEPAAEVYLYDAAADELSCASCNPTGQRPLGPASLPTWSTPFQQPRYLSEDGRRLFFSTYDALVASDFNKKQDVYEFERPGTGSCTEQGPTYDPASDGCVYLITSGSSDDESYLVDASADGEDVFFETRQGLLAGDRDDRYDAYDARVGGGFPEAAPPLPCAGEACRPPAAPAPATAPPASSTFTGPGNLPKTKPKKKKQRKKQNRRKKKNQVKKHNQGKHHHRNKEAGR